MDDTYNHLFEKWDHFENRPLCKGYSPCKILTLGQKLKFQKTCQNPFYKSFRVVLCKKHSKKHQIFQKWDHFENRPSCKGYSPYKILTLGQKWKFQKTCQNPFYKSFRVVLCKKRSKKHQIFQKWDHFENRPSCKGYSPCKILTLGQKLKFQKTCQNPFYKSFRAVLCKKRSKKHQIFQKWDHFENWPSCKGYSPCKILTLGQKLKFQKNKWKKYKFVCERSTNLTLILLNSTS